MFSGGIERDQWHEMGEVDMDMHHESKTSTLQ